MKQYPCRVAGEVAKPTGVGLDELDGAVESAQFTSIAVGNRCKEMGAHPSMRTVGDAHDNVEAA